MGKSMAELSGIFIDPETGLLGVAGVAGHIVRIGMSPDEMRALADELREVADRMERQAKISADSVIARARGTLQ